MSMALRAHVDTPSTRIGSIEVQAEQSANGKLSLRYHVEAPLSELEIPGPADPVRTNGLWQTTCFEAFVRRRGASDYVELNFSISSQWAAYHFDSYRTAMTDLILETAPEIGVDASESHIALEAVFALPARWNEDNIEFALSAVIEETDGTKSYWALAHPPGAPDFHHPDCFALALPAPEAP
jgi:hypothetical protein